MLYTLSGIYAYLAIGVFVIGSTVITSFLGKRQHKVFLSQKACTSLALFKPLQFQVTSSLFCIYHQNSIFIQKWGFFWSDT